MHHLPDIPQDAFEQRLFELATRRPRRVRRRRHDPRARTRPPRGCCSGSEDAPLARHRCGTSCTPTTSSACAASSRPVVAATATCATRSSACASCGPAATIRWAEVRAVVDHDAGLCHIVARDITGRDEADAERLSEAFRDAPTGMAIVQPDGRFSRVNGALCRLLGRDRGRAARDERARPRREPATPPQRWVADTVERRRARLVRARGAHAHRRRPPRRRARQRHARPRPRRRAAALPRPVPRRHRAHRGPGRARRQRGQARRGAAGRAARQLGVARRGRPRHLVRRALPHPRPAPRGARRRAGHATSSACTPRIARASRATIEQGVADGRAWNLDHRILRPDGDVRLSTRAARSPTTPRATSSRVHGTCQDVTESRRVEDALRAAEQLFRRAFDDSPIGMALIDLEGRWLRLNRALAQMAGRTEADLRADDARRAQPPRGRRARPPAGPRAARRPPPQLRDREAHDARRRARAAPARARLADARRRRAPAVLPRPARSTSASAAAPRPSAAPASSACRRSSTTRRR